MLIISRTHKPKSCHLLPIYYITTYFIKYIQTLWYNSNFFRTHLTLVKTISTSVDVTFLPSITLQSLQSLAQFLPFISFPVALVSPWTANFLKALSSWSTSVLSAILPMLEERNPWLDFLKGKHGFYIETLTNVIIIIQYFAVVTKQPRG